MRKFAAAALVIFFLFAGLFATAQQASADTGIPSSGATGAMADPAAGIPPGSTAVPPPAAGNATPEAPVDLAQPAGQDATTAQAATADATAAQPQQSNGIGTTRTDSSGDESASQENDVSVVGAAADAASTSQTAGSDPPPADGAAADDGQQATTDQAADAAAAAVQPEQSNVVIIIRINSPGDDVISQTNVVSVVAVGANQSSTTQDPATAPAPAPAAASAPATTDPPQSSSQSLSGTAPEPLKDSQSGQSSSLGQQPAQQPAAVVQKLRPAQTVRALSILAFSANANASLSAPDRAASPTTSDSRPQPEGAAGRSGAFGSRTAAAPASSGPSVDSSAPAAGERSLVRPQGGAHSSNGGTLGALRADVADWFGRTRVAAGPQLGADSGGGMSLALLTLTALLVGVLGWAALTWPPPLPRR